MEKASQRVRLDGKEAVEVFVRELGQLGSDMRKFDLLRLFTS